ncbi:MAG: hypothetical protein MRERV_11c065 [Mycoplasmataceae bacterium RV_VA103A]|nr:MAG: hypothetical protein MRERV_11c065 [Mycoplasmataceae bacterium RV_VA103A]
MTKNKTWTLAPSHSLILAPPNKRGECVKYHLEKQIYLISERFRDQWVYDYRQFCWSCALNDVYELEKSDYPVKNKGQIIKEIREALSNESKWENQGTINCYE